MKFKSGDKCRIKKLMGASDEKPNPTFKVGSLVIINYYDNSKNKKWPYDVRGMGPNTCHTDCFKAAELELVKRKGA